MIVGDLANGAVCSENTSMGFAVQMQWRSGLVKIFISDILTVSCPFGSCFISLFSSCFIPPLHVSYLCSLALSLLLVDILICHEEAVTWFEIPPLLLLLLPPSSLSFSLFLLFIFFPLVPLFLLLSYSICLHGQRWLSFCTVVIDWYSYSFYSFLYV